MARPKKDRHERRNERFNLRYTVAEIEYLKQQADRAGMGPHEYARRRTLGANVVSPSSRRADPALISELNRIGVNLNQLARATHIGKDFAEEWGDIALDLRRAIELVLASDGP